MAVFLPVWMPIYHSIGILLAILNHSPVAISSASDGTEGKVNRFGEFCVNTSIVGRKKQEKASLRTHFQPA